jgi:hypothetical protein
MFGLFKKNPAKKLEAKHTKLLEEAMQLQRKGDIKGYAKKMEEADAVEKEIANL